jgi:signal transduction histidine kinase
VAETKEAKLIGDVEKHPKARHIPGTPYLDESMIASPMIYEGKVLGVITLSQLGLNQFHSNHLRLLNILAVQAGISIQNARLFADLKKAYQELKLTQSQLVQKEKLASIGQLAAGLAHELNNPLGGILGYSQFASEKIAKKSPKDLTLEDIASYSQYLKEIEQQTQRCKIIVQNLLRFAQATTKVPFEPLDLNRALKEVILFTKEELKRRKVELKENFSKFLPTVIGNSNQLKQVFTQLIFNALQAMPDGGQIMITTAIGEEKETFKKKVLISFSDTGCGIPQDRLDKIFDPFYTTKNTGEGTGLGLSVCYGIIKDHQGEILVESEVGKGTKFTILLPIVEDIKKRESEKEKEEVAIELKS